MNVILFSPYVCLSNIGVRLLSSSLRQHGHTVRLVFAPFQFDPETPPRERLYPESMLRQLLPLCEDAELIGLTLMTDFYFCSKQVTAWLRRHLDTPIVWGGVHPTVAPDECARHADYVVVGEAEDSLVELAAALEAGQDPSGIPSLWGRGNGVVFSNPVRPLRQDLDGVPLPDYDFTDHHLYHEGRFKRMTHDLMRENMTKEGSNFNPGFNVGYQILTSRGCPHRCTYCINYALKRLQGARGYMRWRSVENVIEELEIATRAMPYIDYIWISDDVFFARKIEDLQKFARMYTQRIGLPFSCLVSPIFLNETKLKILMDAGLGTVQMGVQTMSPETAELFHRQFMTGEHIRKAMDLLGRHRDRLGAPHYDFIIENPFESLEQELETLRFIADMPRPYFIRPFSLHLFPGTELFRRAEEQGVIPKEGDMGERWHHIKATSFSYTKVLFKIFKRPVLPGWVLKALLTWPLPQVLGRKCFEPLIYRAFVLLRWIWRRLPRKRKGTHAVAVRHKPGETMAG